MVLKRLAKYTVAGLGAVGLTAVATRALREDELEPALDGDHRSFRWRGMDIQYTEAGDPTDDTIVLFHGINAAGTSGEFRAVFSELAEDYHVVAPDLPGFGCSDRPPLRYSAPLYEDFVSDFLSEFDRPAVVASSLTGAYVAAAADSETLRRLILICPTTVAGPSPPRAWLRELFRVPVVGEALFGFLASKPSIRYFNADHGYYDTSNVTEEWVDYEWRTAHQSGARFAPASFIAGYLNSDTDLGAALRGLDVPVTFVWGREAEITPLADGRSLAEESDARLVVLDRAKLLPHVEYPDTFLDIVRDALGDGSADQEFRTPVEPGQLN